MGAAVPLESKPSNPVEMPHIGPYKIVRRLDNTGTSAIYAGLSRHQNRPAIIKTFTPRSDASRDQQWEEAERWLSVMNIVVELCNPPRVHAHLVRVTDARIFAETAEGVRHYAVMEQLMGPSLETRVKSGPVSLYEVGDYALMIASALDALHEAGVAHGNVTSDNILFVSERSHVLKLVGFGMSSLSLAHHPEAAQQDRMALVLLVKHLLSAKLLTRFLTEEGKRVMLQALDAERGYPTATEFARAFQEALPRDLPAQAQRDDPSFLEMPVEPKPKIEVKVKATAPKRKGFWMLSL